MKDTVLLEIQGNKIAILSFNREEKRNALNISLLKSLKEKLTVVQKDNNLRALIITGKGSFFSAGLDLVEAEDEKTADESNQLLYDCLKALYLLPIVTIALVNGGAFAGGLGIATASDYIIAEESALFGYPEVKRGLIAALVSTFLKQRVLDGSMRKLLLFGELIKAKEAFQMGLLSEIVADGNLEKRAFELSRLLMQGGKEAIKGTKDLMRHLTVDCLKDLELGLKIGKAIRNTEEAKEGMRAFKEKRKPNW